MNKKTAQKWKLKKEKEEESPTAINFKTHQVSESEEEIIIPKQYPQFNKNQQILVIECGKEKLLVQVGTPNHDAVHQNKIQDKSEISVLKTLLDLHGIQCGSTGMFKGQIRILNQNKIVEHNLQIVEFLIKQTYFSRRDQYKVMKALRDSLTHVYLRKTLYFDQIAIEVYSMMRNNQSIAKTGVIDKNTKIIFRSNCCKLTIGIELSVQTFKLNQNKELYLEKMIEFLYVFLQRNNYFNNSHRLTLMFYGRCFYPKFKTLKEAYDYLIKENTSISEQEKYEINFSVALQKDYKGRIYQDVYRRIIWSSDMIDNFREYFWEKISQFLFTINWDNSNGENHIGRFITKSLGEKINSTADQGIDLSEFTKSDLKIKPFLHKMKSTLSYSKDSNMFEAISLISQQYRHHYKFRSLNETGNNIIILTAGRSEYQVDELSYKMAKSYIYLTNICCSLVNFSKKIEDPLRAEIVCINKKPLYRAQDKKKLENLILNCIEKQVYISPMSEDMIIWDNFQLKNKIYPQEIIQMTAQKSQQARLDHNCKINPHFQLCESVVLKPKVDYTVKTKNVSFISVYNMSDLCLYIHQKFDYSDKLKINRSNYSRINEKYRPKELDIFEADLDKIIIGRKTWNLNQPRNEITSQIESYQRYLQRSKNMNKEDRNRELERVNKIMFKKYNQIQPEKQKQMRFQTMSNDEFNIHDNSPLSKRKNSESYSSEILDLYDQVQPEKGKINIFEATYRNKNHEYNAGQKNLNRQKKYITHNKQRRKNLYFQSNIHYLMPQFNEQILKKFKAFIRKEYIEEFKEEEESIIAQFQMEKIWKNLCFPLLTPIYTKYKQNFQKAEEHLDEGVIDESNDKNNSIKQDEICKLLMKNYQIEESSNQFLNSTTKMSKGQVSCHLKMNGNNLSRSHIIDKERQEKIIPFMLYRYLCYQDKDCRFCAKYVYFEDKNYYDFSKRKDLETKTIKIVLGYEDGPQPRQSELMSTFSGAIGKIEKQETMKGSFNLSSKKQRDPFQDFIRLFNQKYQELKVQLIGKNNPLQIPKKKKMVMKFVHHEQIEIQIDLEYNFSSLFEILVSWNICSSVIVNEFVKNVNTMARRSKLKPFLVTASNIFNTTWSITTIGEIIFQHRISLDLLQRNILESGEWLWDSNDYYLHISGISFIQFKKDKRLILWRDNNNEKRNIDIKKDDSARQYNKFFMKSAMFDFLGGIINRVIKDAQVRVKVTVQ